MQPTMRRGRVWGVVLAALGGLLCFVPLFDLVAYEAAFVFALASSLMGAHLGASTVFDWRQARPGSAGLWAEAHPARTVFSLWLAVAARVWLWLLVPLGLLTLNALRVRNCAYANGLAWWALLPMTSAAMGAAAGVVAGLLGLRRRIGGTLVAVAIVLGSIVWSVVRFYAAPPIFAYDPFAGYFPGTLYDEEVAIGPALLWARVYHATVAAAALLVCATLLDGTRLRLSLRHARVRLGAIALGATFVALAFHHAHARLGFFYTADDLARALGAARRTPHFILHYSPKGPWAKDIDLHAEEHEYRWSRLRELLGVEPEAPVHAFLFDSADEKQRLMGAAHTFVAKPWRREIYLQAEGWPHPVLEHELAHVFAGTFGDPIFGVSRAGLRVNVGLIEGVAVAASWKASPLTPHETVKTMRERHLEPPLGSVLSLGFLGLNASQAYNVAGSFSRYLLDHYPARALADVFRAAGSPASWTAAYDKPLPQLAEEWSRFIDGVTVPARESAVVRDRLARPSVFHKVCAHELALKREEAQKRQAAGDKTAALSALESVCADDPDDPQNVAALMEAADASGLPERARAEAQRLLGHPKASSPEKARAWVTLGDLALRQRARDEARRAYDEAMKLPLDDNLLRLTHAKQIAAAEPPGRAADLLIDFLVQPADKRDPALDLLNLRELVALEPERELFHYLFARQLEARGRYHDAADELERALAGDGRGLPDSLFVREARRLQGRALYRADELERAQAAFETLARDESSAARLEADDWLRRIRFRRGDKAGTPSPR
jgi:tetratricopeptide (TPR) repeat protein